MSLADRYDGLDLVKKTPTGDLYRAEHKVLGRPVMVRKLDGAGLTESELAEIRDTVVRTGQLVHPNILSVIDAEFGDDEWYYVTDNVAESLQTRIGDAPFPVDTVARWGLQLLRAIGHAHAHGVIHRGLSPWRVYLDQVGTILLTDFGLSTAVTDRGSGLVTFEANATGYLPVSALRNPASYDERADRYGVAALIVELLTGAVPETNIIDTGAAVGDVPTPVVNALQTMLGGRATAEQLEAATAAFKAWVDALGPGVASGASSTTEHDSNGADEAAPAAEPERTAKAANGASKSSGKRRRRSSRSVRAAAPTTEAEAAPDTAEAQATPDATEAAEGGDDSASRAEDKLNKYSELFDD